MQLPTLHWWGKVPVARLLLALVAGILLQWWASFPVALLLTLLAAGFLACIVFSLLPIATRFRFRIVSGAVIHLLMAATGALSFWLSDVRHNRLWIGHRYNARCFIMARLEEPLVEKPNSMKALASVQSLWQDGHATIAHGKLILYFKKDTALQHLGYGSLILFGKEPQEIRSSGNPGSFDYKKYCSRQGIMHQAYLLPNEFEVLDLHDRQAFTDFIFKARLWVVSTIRRFVSKEQQGLAEALLIGYKDDLDKDLVQAYSNTGVVHVIAISGLHLGLIYGLLLLLTKPLGRKGLSWLRLVLIVASLWLFSVLAGAQPSVLRSAVMFSFIAWGQVISRKGSIFNTLALSAFLLLCGNPFWLWDAGFQLSYMAVISIIVFFKPVYNWVYLDNRLLDTLWKLNAVTISAQLLTLPVSLYHFHQVPTLFLFTNLVAVPLSSLILMGELLLCALFFLKPVATLLGQWTGSLIAFMNYYIERFDRVSFAVWEGLSVNAVQAIALTLLILSLCFWLMEKKRWLLRTGLSCLLMFSVLRSISFIRAKRQQKLIVYQVPRHSAMDLLSGRHCRFVGDDDVASNWSLFNFHIRPGRILHRVAAEDDTGPLQAFRFGGRNILVLDTPRQFAPGTGPPVDLLVLSKNPRLYLPELARSFVIRQVVIDASVPAWKSALWKKDCDSLRIPCHDVSEKGAFVMSL